MRKLFVIVELTLVASSFALAHEGYTHILGTVKSVHENDLELSVKDGGAKTVVLTDKTTIFKGDEKADRSALVAGVRVSVEVDKENKVVTIKVAAEEHQHQH